MAEQPSSPQPIRRVGVTGASGLVGRAICAELETCGFEVVRFSRSAPPQKGADSARRRFFSTSEPLDCSGLEAVIHLAGESIQGLWTAAKKRAIYESRVLGTRAVVEGLRRAGSVQLLINASAIGFYGFAGDEILDESSPPGDGFLAKVCEDWEEEAFRAHSTTTRVAVLRIGLVLGHGGALTLMTPVFRMGLGGRLGRGQQWMCAVHVRDLAGMCLHLLARPDLAGPFNAVMPEPFTNAAFTEEMARAVRRPALLPVPAFVLRTALGGLSDLLLGSCRVVPTRFLECDYNFAFPTLRSALEDLLSSQR